MVEYVFKTGTWVGCQRGGKMMKKCKKIVRKPGRSLRKINTTSKKINDNFSIENVSAERKGRMLHLDINLSKIGYNAEDVEKNGKEIAESTLKSLLKQIVNIVNDFESATEEKRGYIITGGTYGAHYALDPVRDKKYTIVIKPENEIRCTVYASSEYDAINIGREVEMTTEFDLLDEKGETLFSNCVDMKLF